MEDHQSSSSSFGRSWTPIGETSNQLIVYHPPSHAIQVVPHPQVGKSRLSFSRSASPDPVFDEPAPPCALCGRPWALAAARNAASEHALNLNEEGDGRYFRILEKAHEMSRPSTPPPRTRKPTSEPPSPRLRQEEFGNHLPAMGYYKRFFREEKRLGMGAEGSVYLATHIISGNILGTYAVKKIAVGTSKEYLVKMLREVRLLETLRHPNIIPYYHSWMDETHFSSFGPPTMALHVLMMYASAGNLDDFLLSRSHTTSTQAPVSAGDLAATEAIDLLPKAERIKAFKQRRKTGMGSPKVENRGVLLLSVEEILHLFTDIVEGLAFLHSSSILHLDLKCSNVLLHWEDGQVIPKAMLSDFGTSEETLRGKRDRTGHTGTMEYMAPETIVMDAKGNWRPSDSYADMWSLGMILHKMMFLQLPYPPTEDFTALHSEIIKYQGFVATPEIVQTFERRNIPRNLLLVLERLLHLTPERRPTAERVKAALQGRKSPGLASRVWAGRTKQDDPSKIYTSNRHPRSHSPVRSILGLPAPSPSQPEIMSPPSQPTLDRNSQPLALALFVAKIFSLQSRIIDIPLPVFVVVVLTGLALTELNRQRRHLDIISLGSAVVHIGVLCWYFALSD